MRKPGGSVGAGEEDQQEKPPAPPRLYHSGTEQVIGWLANTTPGGMPPLLPRLNPREDISVILTNDIAIREDDNAATVAAKENLAYAKQALKEYLAEGGTPDMFLNAYHDHLRVAFDEWRNAQRYASELVKAGEQEAAVRFVEEQNRVFAAKGIRPIRLIGPRQPPSK